MPIQIEYGGFTMLFEPETGFLRRIRYGGQEVVRAVYAAVRDENWATLRHELLEVQQFETSIAWRHRCWKGDVPYLEFDGLISWEEKRVKYRAIGRPLREFMTARTGICLLHPREQAGLPVAVTHPSGAVEEGMFPINIAPEVPFTDVTAMKFRLDELKVGIHFFGEEFETEDQRNWMDASFKTYCWPQHRGWPYSVGPDKLIEHTVDVTIDGPGEPAVWPVPLLDWETAETVSLPILGTVVRGEAPELTPHLGSGTVIASGDMDQLAKDLEVAEASGMPITLHVRLAWARAMLESIPNPQIITRVHLDLAYADRKDEVEASFPDVSVLLASSENFTDLNRYQGYRADWAGVAFAGNPQVHAFDDVSIAETPATLGDQIRSAEGFNDGLVAVGPLTLEPNGWSSRAPDCRYRSDLYAAWVLACVINAAQAGAYSLTIGESAGDRGFYQDGDLTLAGRVLSQLGQSGGEIKVARSSAPDLVVGVEMEGVRLIAHMGQAGHVEWIDL